MVFASWCSVFCCSYCHLDESVNLIFGSSNAVENSFNSPHCQSSSSNHARRLQTNLHHSGSFKNFVMHRCPRLHLPFSALHLGSLSLASSPSSPLVPLLAHLSISFIPFQPFLNAIHMSLSLRWISQRLSTLSVTVQFWTSFPSSSFLTTFTIGLSLSFVVTRTAPSSETRSLVFKTLWRALFKAPA